MMKKFYTLTILVLLVANSFGVGKDIAIEPILAKCFQYKPVLVNVVVTQKFENPYDQDDICVDALFVEPGSKDSLLLPCLFVSGKSPKSRWQARFAPRKDGKYTVVVRVRQGGVTKHSEPANFNVVESNEKGFLSYNPANPYFYNFDNGEKFRGIGLNIGWEFEPKWNSEAKYTYRALFAEMKNNNANYFRTWLCPWNMPIEWSPVINYRMLTEEFIDWKNVLSHSAGLQLSAGTTPVTQADNGQLIKTTADEQTIIYKLDSVRSAKVMIYFTGEIKKDDIKLFYSVDNKDYKQTETEFSESWDATDKWKRIFLFNYNEIPQPANYVKVILGKNIGKDNVKIAGIQFKYGKEQSRVDGRGLSHYSEQGAKKLESMLDLSKDNGLYVMLTLGYHGQFNPVMDSWGANDEWQRNPYNVRNGGPCKTPADFFSNKEAKRHYKNYLRYMVARFALNTHIAAWEFWNEIDITQRSQKVPMVDLVSWHDEMSTYLNSIDPFKHVITTSISWGDMPELWNVKNIQLTQVHHYEPAEKFIEQTTDIINKYNKPHVIGEYAIGWKGPGNDFSDEQYENEFHDGLWRGLISPVQILPMSWWWDYHFDKKQYFHFKPIALITEEMKAQKETFAPLALSQKAGFDIVGIKTAKLSLIWIKKKASDTKLSLSIPVNKPGKYAVKLFNTWTGEYMSGEVIDGKTTVDYPEIELGKEKDILVVVTPQKR